nr:hypothetical protein [Pseudovibrio sp. Tun.PSC04-5.I4]
MAELEPSLISERVTAGMRVCKSRGISSVTHPSHPIFSQKSNVLAQKQPTASIKSKGKLRKKQAEASSVMTIKLVRSLAHRAL